MICSKIKILARPGMTNYGANTGVYFGHTQTIVLLDNDIKIKFRLNSKAPSGMPIRIPRITSSEFEKRRLPPSSAHWEHLTRIVEDSGLEHVYWPKLRKDCLRLPNCDVLTYLRLAGCLPQVEEYLEGGEETPSLLCDFFGFSLPSIEETGSYWKRDRKAVPHKKK